MHLEALQLVLSQGSRVRVLATVSQADELLACVRDIRPDVVLIDAVMTDATRMVTDIRGHGRDVKVVVITEGDTEAEVIQLAEAGVSGYVLPDGSLDALVVALESAVRGELYCTPRVAFSLLRRIKALALMTSDEVNEPHSPLGALTPREREVLVLIDQGKSNKEIANDLRLTVATVKNHVHNILEKLHVHKRINASAWYRRGGFHLKLEA